MEHSRTEAGYSLRMQRSPAYTFKDPIFDSLSPLPNIPVFVGEVKHVESVIPRQVLPHKEFSRPLRPRPCGPPPSPNVPVFVGEVEDVPSLVLRHGIPHEGFSINIWPHPRDPPPSSNLPVFVIEDESVIDHHLFLSTAEEIFRQYRSR